MGVINQVVRHVSLAVVRSVVEIGARQDPNTTVLSGTVSPTSGSATPGFTPSTVASPSLSDTPSIPTGDSPGQDGTDDGGTNSPLLFFVALGFGVVFTNLWIIVGVKYCFRYNARARAMRANANGEPITMENMARPRRRREKKLMTIEEVNEKFPMMKYKSWVSAQALQGLPTSGGVSAPPSRANSVRSIGAISPELTSKDRTSTDEQIVPKSPKSVKPSEREDSQDEITTLERQKTEPETNTATAAVAENTPEKQEPHDERGQSSHTTPQPETTPNARDITQHTEADDDDEDEDEEHITAAMPNEWYSSSGDTCAICIDTLEDDDDIRGLTCGHTFHAVCVDPWLLSRRACCPLCKRDYYTPKPGAQAQAQVIFSTNQVVPERRRASLLFRARHARSNPSSNTQTTVTQSSDGGFVTRLRSVFQPQRRESLPPSQAPETQQPETQQPQARTLFRPPNFRLFRRGRQNEASPNTANAGGDASPSTVTDPTPSQLEAGTR